MTTVKELREIARANSGYKENPEIFASAIEHMESVAALTKELAIALGKYKRNIITPLETSALLHDVGKLLMTPEELLDETKYYPGNNPWRCRHVELGKEIAKQQKWNPLICNGIWSHHESYAKPEWGYPGEKQGDEIPELVRLMSAADAFVAMDEDRPYRPRMSFEKIRAIMTNHNHEKFDPFFVNFLFEYLTPRKTKEDSGEKKSTIQPIDFFG